MEISYAARFKSMTKLIQENPKPASATHGSKSRAGSSIVEALCSLVVFALFITGATKLLMTHRRMTDMAQSHYLAANIAKNRLELVRSFEYEERDRFGEDKVRVNSVGLPDETGDYRRSTLFFPTGNNVVELVVAVEIKNRKTLAFDGRNETLKSYFAYHNARPN